MSGDSAAEESECWEPDASDNDTAAEASEYDEKSAYESDVSCKSAAWCRELYHKIEMEGLTPKASGMKKARPPHLRYIQSYAEEPLDGESDEEAWAPGPNGTEGESEAEASEYE